MPQYVHFKTNVLKTLIEQTGISEEELARKLGIASSKISEWEDDKAQPTYKQLTAVADVFKKSVIVFFMDNPCINDVNVDFRSLSEYNNVCDKVRINELIESATFYRNSLEDIFAKENFHSRICELRNKFNENNNNFNNYLRDILDFSIEKQCVEFHRATDAIEYLRERFFDLGIFIFKDSFRLDEVSGLCLYDDNFPIIIINNRISFTRQLFTIFHELYHLIVEKSHIDLTNLFIEKECDSFAGKFLIPEEGLILDVGSLDLNNADVEFFDEFLSSKANYYNVSRESYLYQLKRLNFINNDVYRNYISRNKNSFVRSKKDEVGGGNYYFTKMNYLGKEYLGELVARYFTGKITLRNVAKYTQMKVPNVKKMIMLMSGGRY